jgi:hypothetical protein
VKYLKNTACGCVFFFRLKNSKRHTLIIQQRASRYGRSRIRRSFSAGVPAEIFWLCALRTGHQPAHWSTEAAQATKRALHKPTVRQNRSCSSRSSFPYAHKPKTHITGFCAMRVCLNSIRVFRFFVFFVFRFKNSKRHTLIVQQRAS